MYLEILERFMVQYIQVAILWLTKYNVKFSVRITDWARPNGLIYVYVVSKLHRVDEVITSSTILTKL